MSKRIYTVQEIVQQCGGRDNLSENAGVSHWAIYKWIKNGIPEEHWEVVRDLSGLSVEDIYDANLKVRGALSETAA